MEKIVDIYNKLREKDKKNIKNIPLENRIILSQLITNSAADRALKYAWVNRALAQSTKKCNSAILSLDKEAPKEQLLARKLSKGLREKQNLSNPIEIFDKDDFSNFIRNYHEDNIVVKQNYPSDNDEIRRLNDFNFENKKIQIANTKEAYDIIESKKCLAEIAEKDRKWLEDKISEYVKYIFEKNKIEISYEQKNDSCKLMTNLVFNFLIPTRKYKGNITGLYSLVLQLVEDEFLPVFKFNYSVSGYGVHYPKTESGKYDIETFKKKLYNEETFINYLTEELNKNGQIILKEDLINNINKNGITLQKYIFGHEHSIGYYKPLEDISDNFCLALTEFVVTDVLVEGTAHCGNVLHYDDEYIFKILEKTKFNNKANLLHFSIEIILYLMYLNEGLINNPSEYKKMCVEDFGIQFIVNDETGEVGLIEFNGRTPSCNLNHYHLLSKYGVGFEKKNILPTNRVVFTNAKIMDIDKMDSVIKDKDMIERFLNDILELNKQKFKNKCELVSLQIVNNDLSVNFAYFLKKQDNVNKILKEVKKIFINEENKNEFYGNFK